MLESNAVVLKLAYFRSVVYTIPLCSIATAILICGAFLTATQDGVRMQEALFKWWARCILRICRVQLFVHGLENIQANTNYIFASNHASLLDVPVLIAAIPNDFRFLVKYRFIPLVELFLHQTGQIPIRRANPTETNRSLDDAARILSASSRSLLVFPEGDRSDVGLRTFRDDAAFLSITCGRSLVPIRIIGTREILPKNSTIVRGGSVHVYVGNPISTSGLGFRGPKALTDDLRDHIATLAG
jgi:1-acyl-sn-glycerol-3-phosphate acyltransferase